MPRSARRAAWKKERSQRVTGQVHDTMSRLMSELRRVRPQLLSLTTKLQHEMQEVDEYLDEAAQVQHLSSASCLYSLLTC